MESLLLCLGLLLLLLSQDYTTKAILYGRVNIASLKGLMGGRAVYTRVQHFAMHQLTQFSQIFSFMCGGDGYDQYTNGHTHACTCVCCCGHIWRLEVILLVIFCDRVSQWSWSFPSWLDWQPAFSRSLLSLPPHP